MGMLASASVGDSNGFYEPIHGAAHDIAGKGLANPLAAILSAALMLDISFGLKTESQRVIKAVEATLRQGYRTMDIANKHTENALIVGTDGMGGKVLENLS
jgi:3-isopropylmalate dehydrogenase